MGKNQKIIRFGLNFLFFGGKITVFTNFSMKM